MGFDFPFGPDIEREERRPARGGYESEMRARRVAVPMLR